MLEIEDTHLNFKVTFLLVFEYILLEGRSDSGT